jgi:hypothetical protein
VGGPTAFRWFGGDRFGQTRMFWMMDICIWCMAAIIEVTSWFIWVIWFIRAWICVIAEGLLATSGGMLPLVTACMN